MHAGRYGPARPLQPAIITLHTTHAQTEERGDWFVDLAPPGSAASIPSEAGEGEEDEEGGDNGSGRGLGLGVILRALRDDGSQDASTQEHDGTSDEGEGGLGEPGYADGEEAGGEAEGEAVPVGGEAAAAAEGVT